ncbi:MAG: hypothetical protein OEU32_12075 [Acidimicrobiia bacterium]|nr:hypothetical protein [Acidimicrobiia bacterium]
MTTVLALLLVNVVLGAWDTLWYHEYRARLSARLDSTRTELRLHVTRDAVYVVLYSVLAWWQPSGWLVVVAAVGLTIEIGATMCDFIVEDRDRPAIGGLAPGERVLHTLMALVYGAMLSRLVPILVSEIDGPTTLVSGGAPAWMGVAATGAAVGIAVSGARDALALRGYDPVWRPVRT